ncbi:MFS transporter [Bifidobacterium panos]|uniref:MFS transporter n=1 Tax=Bifidobacterium panos TaxID=2675321 RepID=A0ABX1SVE3_9BIFI|nr:MFS transporter [Bifidobacterium sp. DSM 109963]NMN01800.1 MFS transporter [Bifidobacterium sp. DSM 109963]
MNRTISEATASSDKLSPSQRKYLSKVTISSFIGNTLEYYDYFVYGTASAIAFPSVFFAHQSTFVAALSSFATFAVGFLARPLGGLFFGSRGDKSGRKSTLILTLLIMGTGTFLIGCIPSVETIGIAAPILLIVLRLVQGFAVGGEWGGSMLIVLESAPKRSRGFWSAWPQTGGFSSQIIITLIFAWVYTLPEDAMLSWGWRVPFWASALVMVMGLWMRRSLEESPVFTQTMAAKEKEGRNRSLTVENLEATMAARDEQAQTAAKPAAQPAAKSAAKPAEKEHGPLYKVFVEDWRDLLRILGLRFAESLPYFLLCTFALSYGPQHLGIPKDWLNWAILIMSVLAFPAHGFFSWLSDRIGRRPVYMIGTVVVFLTAFPFFLILQTGSFGLIVLGYIIVLNLGHNAINAVQPSFFSELFPADRRYSGAASGREIASILTGGLTPFIATWLAGANGEHWYYVAAYVMIGAVITAIAVWLSPETYRRDLYAIGKESER